MAQRKILLDSNSYFRLAQTFHPLLQVEFGEECHCLYVIRELQQEFDRSARLQNKFHWVTDPRYVKNRHRAVTIPRKAARTIDVTLSVILGHARQEELGPRMWTPWPWQPPPFWAFRSLPTMLTC